LPSCFRPSFPVQEPVMAYGLFITCLADTLAPEVGRATVRVLERAGVELEFPREQTCCGQMHFNAGHEDEARTLARRFLEVFEGYEAIVTPSGSCAAHVRTHIPRLVPDDHGVPGRTRELSEFLVERGGPVDLGSSFRGSLTYHPTCHSLRLLRVGDGPLSLLRAAGVDVVELPDAEECCGFGGTFAVKNADVSSAMLDAKLDRIVATGADAVCACDASCLMHIGGGLRRRGSRVRPVHLAEVLAL
jgi:L-lactate dehydrogenase complex protein LldE